MHILNTDTQSDESATGRPTDLFNDWRGHGRQAAHLARDIAQELGLSEGAAARVEKAARCHDIGKSKLPNVFDDIPEQCDPEQSDKLCRPERELLRSHTWLGYRILQGGPNPDNWVADAALLHHEWWNGNGYPLGLAQSHIPLVARIVAVADECSTLLEQRLSSSPWHVADALANIRTRSATRFDPECVNALVAVLRRQDTRQGFHASPTPVTPV